MKVFFDTEFIEDGKTIDLLSIGAIREDGAVFYAENLEADHTKASDWVRVNVLPKLLGGVAQHSRKFIADAFRHFSGEQPEFWAYYADYDWVVLCQLYGRMVDLPDGWPMFCRDVKQLCMEKGNPTLPPKDGAEHHALQDARWAKGAWEFLTIARPEATRASVIEECAKAINKKMTDFCEDPEVCWTEPDTGAVVFGGNNYLYVEGLDDAEAVVRALLTPSPQLSAEKS